MKKAFVMMGLGAVSLLWGSQELTIQVINAVYEKSITRDFEEKLKQSALPITKKAEKGRYVVTLGTYKDEESAKKDLEKVRNEVMKDAFIRPIQRTSEAVAVKSVKSKSKTLAAHTPKKESKSEKTKVAVKNLKTDTATTEASSVSSRTNEPKTAIVIEEKKPEHKAEAVVAPKAAKESVEIKEPLTIVEGASCPIAPTASEVKTIPVLASVVMVERNELRRKELHDAIEYYKNSPYHRFEPVKLQP